MTATCKPRDLGNGFQDHGVAVPISSTRGVVAASDGAGRDVVLTWLADCQGCTALLILDVDSGKSETYPMPFPPEGNAPFCLLLSSANRFYTHFHKHLVEFDLNTRTYVSFHRTASSLGVGLTEDDQGRVWGAAYPDSGVFMLDPRSGQFRDYGSVYQQNWRQYPYHIATDDSGWVYFAIGKTLSQILAFNPETGTAAPLLPEADRVPGVTAYLHRDEDGKVYGLANEKHWDGQWYELYRGKVVKMTAPAPQNRKQILNGMWPFHRDFPSGRKIKTFDVTNRVLTVEDPGTQQERTLKFDYSSEGAHVMEVAALPDGRVGGGVAFPMRFFSHNPKLEKTGHWEMMGQTNVLTAQGASVFVGAYTEGLLLELDPDRAWVTPDKAAPNGNPRLLTFCEPDINRPHAILAHSDNRMIVMGGTPGYGCTGGGLVFWDRATQERVLVKHAELLPDHCVMALAELPGKKLLVGSGTRAGTGGEVRAKEAELYVLDMATKKIEWHAALIPGIQEYSELRPGPGGLIYGIADFRVYEPTLMDEEKRFFVFDPAQRKIIYHEDTAPVFGYMHLQQGQRKIVVSPEGQAYLLFRKGIAKADPITFKLSWVAPSPVSINAGGDWQDGRIWFASGARLYSYAVQDGVKGK